MRFKLFAVLAMMLCCKVMATNFTAYDTTVQVKIWNNGLPDSVFIKLRNTGFTLAYTAMSYDGVSCPMQTIQGDFVLRPSVAWDAQGTTDFGDSANFVQTSVMYFCDLGIYYRRVLTPGYKYQAHWWYKGSQTDTIFTRVKSIVNDSTFVLSVSPIRFTESTSLHISAPIPLSRVNTGAYTINGRKSGTHSRIKINRSGIKFVDFD